MNSAQTLNQETLYKNISVKADMFSGNVSAQLPVLAFVYLVDQYGDMCDQAPA